MMELDSQMRREIAEQVAMAVRDTLSKIEERWLTADELCKQFGMISKEWLKEYGDTLPRQRVTVEHMDGTMHRTRWAYPMHEINCMIMDGRVKHLKVMKM